MTACGKTEHPETLVIENATLIDGTGEAVRAQVAIHVRDGRIVAIGRDLPVPENATAVDASGKTVVPGLFDMHGHLYGRGAGETLPQHETYAALYLAGGVTTVFSPGSRDPEGAFALREAIDSGKLPGPRLHLAGQYVDFAPSGVSWIAGFDTPDAAISNLDANDTRLNAVKIYSNATIDFAKPIVTAAHERGLLVTAHIGAMTVREAAEAGVDGLEHGIFTMNEITGASDFMEHVCAVSEKDMADERVDEIIETLASRDIYLTPTTVTFQSLNSETGNFPYGWRRFLSIEAKDVWANPADNALTLPADIRECIDTAVTAQVAFIGKAREAGVRILTGTDPILPMLMPGYAIHLEIGFLLRAGFSIEEAIRAASLDAAEILAVDDDLGSVEVGKYADLLIVEGDVSANPSALFKPVLVMKGGVQYDPMTLRESAEAGIR